MGHEGAPLCWGPTTPKDCGKHTVLCVALAVDISKAEAFEIQDYLCS